MFITERGAPMTEATVRKLVARAGSYAQIGFPVHPHMLRHATGFYLAKGLAYLLSVMSALLKETALEDRVCALEKAAGDGGAA